MSALALYRALAAALAWLAFTPVCALEVNLASQAELESIAGIGPDLATRIIAVRRAKPFDDWNDFRKRVRGVGTSRAARLSTEGLTIRFTDAAIGRIADFATLVNERTENIGARRLHTVMEKLLDDVSFDAPDLSDKEITIDDAFVDRMLADIVGNNDLSRYIL